MRKGHPRNPMHGPTHSCPVRMRELTHPSGQLGKSPWCQPSHRDRISRAFRMLPLWDISKRKLINCSGITKLSLAPAGKHSSQLHAGFQMFPLQPTGFISASLFLGSQAREGTLSTIFQQSAFVEGLPSDMIHEWERILMCQKEG